MATLDNYFYKINSKYPDIQNELLEIFRLEQSFSPERSITLIQIRAAYNELTGNRFPVKGSTRIEMSFILTIPFVCCYSNAIGTLCFYLMNATESDKQQYLQ